MTDGWFFGWSAPVGRIAAAAFVASASDWLLDILDLSRACSVGFVTGAIVANIVVLAMAEKFTAELGISILNEANSTGPSSPSPAMPSADTLTGVAIERLRQNGISLASDAMWRDRWVLRLS